MTKKLSIIFSAMVLAFTLNAQTITLSTAKSGISKANDQFTGFQATFSFNQIETTPILNEMGAFSILSIVSAFPAGTVGTPGLPVFRQMIQIPVGATPQVIVKNFSTTEIHLADFGISTVFPTQPSVRKDQTEVPFIFDSKAYNNDAYNDSDIAEINPLGTMRGIVMSMLTINPLQYNPVSHSVLVFNDIEIEVVFENADYKKTEELFVNTFSPYFLKHYDIAFNKGVSKDVYDDHPDLYSTPVRMLVIANRMFEATLQPWLLWKTQKGFIVDVQYTDVIGTTAAQIKTHIHNKYNAGVANGTAPTFIIIVGDTPQVPASQTGSYTSKATDLYYARVNTPGWFPDMYYSRMSAQTTQQLANIIEKTLYYEKYQFVDPTYLDNALLIAGYHDNSTWDVYVGRPSINYANNYYFNAAHGYANIYKYVTTNYTGCYTHLSNGVGFANYTAHCGETSWGDPSFTASQVNSLTNVNKYFVAMGNCCLAADFGYTSNGGVCFGEAMVHAQQKGAVAYIGSSPNSYWGEDFHFQVGAYAGNIQTITNPTLENTKTGVYDFMFKDADFNTVCSHVFGGNLSVQYAHNNPGHTTHISAPYYWEAYNVLGDGSLMPYFAQAADNNVSHLPTLPIGMDTYEVTAAPGSYVAISKDGLLHGVAVVDASGTAVVPLNPPITSGGDVDIVVTRNQYKPYMVQVQAAALAGPYVVFGSYALSGEDVLTYISANKEIEVTLRNVGTVATTGTLNVSINCSDSQITINQATATCSVIPAGGTATVTFKVTIDHAIVDNKSFLVNVVVVGGKTTWESKMTLKAFAPKFKLEKVFIDGVENGKLNAGSIVNLKVLVANTGGAEAFGIIDELEINSPFVTLACEDESKRSGKNLPAGETTEFAFVLITSPDMPYGHVANFNLVLNALYGRTFEEAFSASNTGSDSYCVPGNTNCSSYNDRITSLFLAKTSDQSNPLINMAPTCGSNGYTDYTSTLIDLEPGVQYIVKVKTGYQGHRVKGWVDLNGNNIFDDSEALFTIACTSSNTEYSANFTISENNMVPGSHRFRIRTRDGSTAPDACGAYSYGQTLDYTALLPEMYPRVQNVIAELVGNNITVNWDTPAAGTPIGYNIYRNGNKLNATLLTETYYAEPATPQNIYAYSVTAVYTGNKESYSEMSNVICFFLTCAVPAQVEGVANVFTATLTWNAPENMEGVFLGYNIYRNGLKINTSLVSSSEYADENLKNGDYIYKVSAMYEHCEANSANVPITIDVTCEVPIEFEGTLEEKVAVFTWKDPLTYLGTLEGYNIFREGVQINTSLLVEKEYRDENLQDGDYSYQINAVYYHGVSELSDPVLLSVGIAEFKTATFNLYPNPTNGNVTFKGIGLKRVEIYDVQGRMLSEFDNITGETTVNLSYLENGIYFVKMYSRDNYSVTKRLVMIK